MFWNHIALKKLSCQKLFLLKFQMQFPSRDVLMEIGTSEIQSRVGFQIFPEEESANRLGIPYVLDKPLYWSLPKDRLGDKVRLTFSSDYY